VSEPLRALESLREVEVPVGARSRVRARIEAELDHRAIGGTSRRRWALGLLAVPVAIVALVVLWPRSQTRAVSVAAGDRYDVALDSGHVSVRGPAEVSMSRDQFLLVYGTVDAQGQLRVQGPSCDVVLDGSAEVSVKGSQLIVRVFAGSAQIVPPVASCERIDLLSGPTQQPITASTGRNVSPPPPPQPTEVVEVVIPPAPAPGREPPPPRRAPPATDVVDVVPPPSPEPPAAPSEAPRPDPLAAAVAAYHAAVALEASDLAAARHAWTTWRARWSQSPLAQSADLHLLSVLERLDRRSEASDLAREFVQRYPRSPRRAEVERMIAGGP
jgi:hypothetical protein